MGVEKFSISLPEDLARALEEIALADGVSRSTVVREAATAYITVRENAARRAARERDIGTALASFDRVAQTWGDDPRSGLEYLDELRGRHGGEVMRPEVTDGE